MNRSRPAATHCAPYDRLWLSTGADPRELAIEEIARLGGDNIAFSATLPSGQRVLFARGARHRLNEVLVNLRCSDAGVVASRSQVSRLEELSIQAISIRVFSDVRPHASAALCNDAASALDGADAIVGWGGGSALGIAKAAASSLKVPLIAVPSTYSGSELTALYGVTHAQRKRVLYDERARAAAVLYDPDLLDWLPRHAAGASLMNCLAHLLECACEDPRDSIVQMAAFAGCQALAEGHRDRLLLAGLWGGLTLAHGVTGVHHAVCHAIGGRTGASHGEINGIVLPAVLRRATKDSQVLLGKLLAPVRKFSAEPESLAPHQTVTRLRDSWGLPSALGVLGVHKEDIQSIASEVMQQASGAWAERWSEHGVVGMLESIL